MEIITCNNNEIGINSYIIKIDQNLIIIDPFDYKEICKEIKDCKVDYILLTHEHYDHIMAVDKIRENYNAKLIAQKFTSQNIQKGTKNLSKFSNIILNFMNKKLTSPLESFDIKKADIIYDDFYELNWKGKLINLIHTPGHSMGSSCIKIDNKVFSGDSLFEAFNTDTKGPGSNTKEYNDITLKFFNSLDKNTKVYPGHYESFLLDDKMNAKEKAIAIFKKRPNFTNCFVNYNSFLEILDNSIYFVREQSIFILKKIEDFYKFYYFISDLSDLKKLEDFFSFFKEEIILEIVSKKDIDLNKYQAIDFSLYKTYSRYINSTKNKYFDSVQYAKEKDLENIKFLINNSFDKLSDYIPNNLELKSFIKNKEMYIIKENNILKGVSIYQACESNYYFRLSCVAPEFRNHLVGYMLASSSPKKAKILTTWIDDENISAKRLNQGLGYQMDGLKNYIFIRNRK